MTRREPGHAVASLLVALIMSAPLGAQDQGAASYTLIDAVRLPAESYVGDQVELRYTLRTAADLVTPGAVDDPPWGEIGSVRVFPRGDEYDVRLLVVPYEPGTLTLPTIDLGPIRLEGMSLVVTSVLEDGGELRSIYGPQRLPGTRLAVFLAVLAVVIPLAVGLYLSGPGRTVLGRILERRRARVPHRNLLRTIDRLEASIRHVPANELYTELVHALQDLMTSRLGFECRAATSTELEAYLPILAARCGASAGTTAPLVDVLRAADEAKFAHGKVRRKTRLNHLERCRSAAVELESARRRLRRTGVESSVARDEEASRVGV